MPSVSNFRGGVCQTVWLPTATDANTDPTHAINEGDWVGVTAGVAYPASHYATAAAFKAVCAGVALQKVGLGHENGQIRVGRHPSTIPATQGPTFQEFPYCTKPNWPVVSLELRIMGSVRR